MGLGATVMCNCYALGKTSPPPVAGSVSVDADGYLTLDLPFEGNEEAHEEFDRWLESACEHPGMEYASEHICNWPGYSAFVQALGQLGWENFPTLLAELPEANGGVLPAESAPAALGELSVFRARPDRTWGVFLVDSETGRPLQQYNPAGKGVFVWSGSEGVELGFDPEGFFVATRGEPRCELFRSMRFEQRLLEPQTTESYRPGKVEFVDLETGLQFVGRTAVSGKQVPWPDGRMENDKGQCRFEYPRLLHVERRGRTAADFAYIVDPLTRVLQAAVKTGNPVRWC
jgi:hypothetical protein